MAGPADVPEPETDPHRSAHVPRTTTRPAWLRQTSGEHRFPAIIAIVTAIGLQLVVPARLALQPTWLLPALETLMLAALIVANPTRSDGRRSWRRWLAVALVAAMSVANGWSAARLVVDLATGAVGTKASELLVDGGAIWLTNIIVFSLWYWELDRGGPAARARAVRRHPDFLFAQMQQPGLARDDWAPGFADYLYLSFTCATAFSSADVLPLSQWAKMIMMVQALVSLVTVVLIIAQAVNLLG